MYNVQNAYMCKLRKELPPVNLVAVTCDSWSGMTGKLVPGSIIVCSMGSSTARGVKITGVWRSPPLPDGVGRRRLAALSGLPDSAAWRQNFFGLYCIPVVSRSIFNVGTKSSCVVYIMAWATKRRCVRFSSPCLSLNVRTSWKSQVDVSGVLVATNNLNARRTLHVLHAAEPLTIHWYAHPHLKQATHRIPLMWTLQLMLQKIAVMTHHPQSPMLVVELYTVQVWINIWQLWINICIFFSKVVLIYWTMPRPTPMGIRHEVFALAREGMKQGAIAARVGLTRATVNCILKRHAATKSLVPGNLQGLPERQHIGKTVHCWGWSDRIVFVCSGLEGADEKSVRNEGWLHNSYHPTLVPWLPGI